MSDQNKINPFGPPSKNYEDARGSSVYRLSELMFGSLLASYILGFIGQASTLTNTASSVGLDNVLRHLFDGTGYYLGTSVSALRFFETLARLSGGADYLLVSVSFSYFTASMYVSYHAGLLTMPQAPLSRLRWDFVIALSQAVLFGLSMLDLTMFPLAFGIAVLLSLWRQRYEARTLVDFIKLLITPANSKQRGLDQKLRNQVLAFFKTNRRRFKGDGDLAPLQSWTEPIASSWLWSALLTLVGALLLVPSWGSNLRGLHLDALVHVLVAGSTIKISHKALGDKGALLVDTGEADSSESHLEAAAPPSAAKESSPAKSPMKKMDDAAEALWNEVKKLKNHFGVD